LSKIEKYNHILTGFGSNIVGNILMFATTIYLTRTFDPHVYGEFRLIFSFIALLVIILLLGRDNGIIYFSQNEERNKDTIIKEEVYFGFIVLLIGTFVLYLFGDFILANFLNKETRQEYFYLSLLMIPLWGFFNLLLASLKSKGLINYTFILSNLVQRAIRVPFFVGLALVSVSYYSLVFGMILSQVVLIYLALKKLPFLLKVKDINLKNFFLRFSYAAQLGFNAIIVVLLTKIDVIMVGKYTENTQVAIYDTCVMLSFVVLLPFIALVKSSEPFMQALIYQKDVQEKYRKNLKLSIELSLGILLFFSLASDDLLHIFGEAYVSGSNTLIVLSASYMLLVMLGSPIEVLNMNGFTKVSSIVLVLSIFINIGLNVLLIPIYGIIGASVATGVSLVFSKLVGLYLAKKNLGVNFLHKTLDLKVYVLFMIFFLLSFFLHSDSWIFHILFSFLILLFFFFSLVLIEKDYRKILLSKI